MKLISRNSSTFALVIFLIFVATSSCNHNVLQEEQAEEAPVVQAIEIPCEPGSTQYFDLTPINPKNATYAWELNSNNYPFSMDDCVCNVQQYDLVFTNPPLGGEMDVEDENGESIPHGTSVDPNTGELTITIHSNNLEYGSTEVYVTMAEPAPAVVAAGGLCIIDNLSGIVTPIDIYTVHFEPVFLKYVTIVGDSMEDIFIPTVMTTPVSR